MDRQTAQDIVNDLEAARRLAKSAANTTADYYRAYYAGKADALYEAIAALKQVL